jgi:hypothetical protein
VIFRGCRLVLPELLLRKLDIGGLASTLFDAIGLFARADLLRKVLRRRVTQLNTSSARGLRGQRRHAASTCAGVESQRGELFRSSIGAGWLVATLGALQVVSRRRNGRRLGMLAAGHQMLGFHDFLLLNLDSHSSSESSLFGQRSGKLNY